MKILITGGAGYIGSHTAVQALTAGHSVVILDNLVNSSPVAITRIEKLTGAKIEFVQGDVRDANVLDEVFSLHSIEVVMHFAGLKAVGESHQNPLDYYDNNVNGTIQLTKMMSQHGIKKLIFSSSATVYGEEAPAPYIETYGRGTPSSPYGASKAMVEQALEHLAKADHSWSIVLLRYFNPVGAHPSGSIGEDPKGIPNNLMPFIAQVAVGKRERLTIFGNDYSTPDGTCQRDYLHVMDLADGHIAALKAHANQGCFAYNLGTGNPVSVLEMVRAFESENNVQIPYVLAARRNGDLPAFWANSEKANRDLDWKAGRTLEEMTRDSWKWQLANPNGFEN